MDDSIWTCVVGVAGMKFIGMKQIERMCTKSAREKRIAKARGVINGHRVLHFNSLLHFSLLHHKSTGRTRCSKCNDLYMWRQMTQNKAGQNHMTDKPNEQKAIESVLHSFCFGFCRAFFRINFSMCVFLSLVLLTIRRRDMDKNWNANHAVRRQCVNLC